MIISLSGPPGSGKSTVAKLLAKKLGFKRYYMGGMRREAAKKRGMTLEEYNTLGETDPSTDLEVDLYQKELGEKEDDFVVEGRTSFHFIPHSIKIYLDVDSEEGAKRVMQDPKNEERNELEFNTIEEKVQNLKERMASDTKRYQKHFGFDCYDKSHYDNIIDTTNIQPEQVVEKILSFIKNRG